jgi:predicted metal-dependent phosphotriesterase family hydrolase
MHDDVSAAPHAPGASDEQIEQMLVSNPRRDLS